MDTQIQKTVNKSELEVTLSIILKTLRLNIFYYLFKKDKKKNFEESTGQIYMEI